MISQNQWEKSLRLFTKTLRQCTWKRCTRVIWAMNMIVRSFNDEDWIEPWLSDGVPDGVVTLEDIRLTYPMSEEFDDEFNELSELFCRLVAGQTARIQMPCQGTDFPPSLEFNAKGVIYCGQKIK